MSRSLKAALAIVTAVGLYQVAAGANGSALPSAPSGGTSSSMPAMMTPEERAIEIYNSANDHREKGRKLEVQALTKQGNDRDKTVAKAKDEYQKALKDYKSAAKINPKLFQAYNGMGYALRKTGDYEQALQMYDQAIKMAPGPYAEAIQYRGEAYLGLNRIDDARAAYMELFALDRKQADALMDAMKTWLEKRKSDPAGVDPSALSTFEKWVGERGEIAKDSQLMALSSVHKGW
jgi:tetratricopeptide (TPR) repeat protein